MVFLSLGHVGGSGRGGGRDDDEGEEGIDRKVNDRTIGGLGINDGIGEVKGDFNVVGTAWSESAIFTGGGVVVRDLGKIDGDDDFVVEG